VKGWKFLKDVKNFELSEQMGIEGRKKQLFKFREVNSSGYNGKSER
jgi:hypothetical protein